LLVILLVLIALVARVDAAPGGASVDLASRHAEALTGAGPAAVVDDDGDEAAEDRAAERAEIDDGEGEADTADDRATEGELPGLLGEIAPAAESLLGDRGDARGPTGLALGDDDGAAGAPASLGFEDAGDAAAGLAFGDDDGPAGGAAGAGALAMLDAELAPGDAIAGLDAADAGATAGAQEVYEQWMRHRRPSPWGRLDVGVSWRHRWSEPIHTPAYSHDEIWLVATWRR
jgi:hypothetical protein